MKGFAKGVPKGFPKGCQRAKATAHCAMIRHDECHNEFMADVMGKII